LSANSLSVLIAWTGVLNVKLAYVRSVIYTYRSQTSTWSTYFVQKLWKDVLWLAQVVSSYFVLPP